MENKIELFGMLSELDTFVDKNVKEIVQEYRKGYKIGNRVIRHSMVVVAN